MTELRPEQVADAWTANSEGYDRNVFDFMRPYVEDVVTRAELAPDAEVLEVAVGTGALTVVAARASKHILATDFSEGMLALLRARCERERSLARLEESRHADRRRLDPSERYLQRNELDFFRWPL